MPAISATPGRGATRFGEQLPDLEFRIWPDAGNLADIEYLAFMHPDFDSLPAFSNLKAMFSRSAGVEPLVNHPKLPNAPLLKIEPPGGGPMMTEYVVMHVLRLHRDMPGNGRYQRVFLLLRVSATVRSLIPLRTLRAVDGAGSPCPTAVAQLSGSAV